MRRFFHWKVILPVSVVFTLLFSFALLYLAGYSPEYVIFRLKTLIVGKDPRDLSGTRSALIEAGYSVPLEDPNIEIMKSDRNLILYDGEDLIRTYEVGLGSDPDGHKKQSGDGKTPVGNYYICTRLNPSSFYLFMGISYPSPEDIQNADLSDFESDSIMTAWESRTKPPWNTSLGGAIGIHGGILGGDSDWTAGCIAIDNDEIEELWLLTGIKTPVTIYP